MSRTADADVISALNEVLTAELTAINQYFVHAKMLQDWGYDTLAGKVRAESIDEMKHADELIERILFWEAFPMCSATGRSTSASLCKSSSRLTYSSSTRRSRGSTMRSRCVEIAKTMALGRCWSES